METGFRTRSDRGRLKTFLVLSALCFMMVSAFLLSACASQIEFEYSLQSENIRTGSVTPLSIQVRENSVEFAVAFQGGGGDNEVARLEKDSQTLRVVLLNIDHVSQKILVLYRLSGTISDLESGSYTLQIEDSTGRLVAEESFDVP